MIAALAKLIDWPAIQAYQTAIDEDCPFMDRIQCLPMCPVSRIRIDRINRIQFLKILFILS